MAKDIILNTDIEFENGDLKVAFSDEQHVEHILLSKAGDFKNVPWIGIGIENYLNAPFDGKIRQTLEREIKLHLESDNAKKVKIALKSIDKINIEAEYEN